MFDFDLFLFIMNYDDDRFRVVRGTVRYMILTQAQGEQFSLILLTVLKVVSVSAIYVYIQKVFLFSFVSVSLSLSTRISFYDMIMIRTVVSCIMNQCIMYHFTVFSIPPSPLLILPSFFPATNQDPQRRES